MKLDLLQKFSEIKLFLFDLEGVLIAKDYTEEDYNELEFFNKLQKACLEFKKLGVEFGIVTASQSEIVSRIKNSNSCIVLSDSINKVALVDNLIISKNLSYDELFYIGNDLLDIPLLQKCKIAATPKDGRREVKRVVTFTTKNNSGNVLNEIIDYFKQSKTSDKNEK